MSNLSLHKHPEKALQSLDINIPQQLHHQPILANLIKEYDLLVNFKAAVLDRNGTGGGWFTLNLEGYPQEIDKAVHYLQHLGVEIFPHPRQVLSANHLVSVSPTLDQTNDRLITERDL
jgi:ABC-type methionine transport system ATPase subunit